MISALFSEVEKIIESGKRIKVFASNDAILYKQITDYIIKQNIDDILLIHNLENNKEDGIGQYLADNTFELLLDMYYRYEFSDCISLVGIRPEHPTSFNYYENNIISKDELFESLLN